MTHFETRALHVGQEPDPQTGAVVRPIYQVSTYRLPDPSEPGQYVYGRDGNPTTGALEACLASLEGGEHALAFTSGMAATTAALSLLRTGDHILVSDDAYGGTFALVHNHLPRYQIAHTFVDMTSADAVAAAMRPNTRMLWAETPTNPLLKVVDIAALAEIAHRHGATVCVDNTFASPYWQNPLALGADIVMHSCTKYLGGHSDLLAGVLVTNEPLYEPLFEARRTTGAILAPFDAWLTLRGVKTLAVRMQAHEHNAAAVVQALVRNPGAVRVYYPGVAEHPQHALAKRQMRGFGGVLSFEIAGGHEAARRFVAALRVFTSAVSLGGVESLAEIPADLTHRVVGESGGGIDPAVVRLAVGLEHPDDLVADVDQALAAAL